MIGPIPSARYIALASVPLALIGCTAGAGSEATPVSTAKPQAMPLADTDAEQLALALAAADNAADARDTALLGRAVHMIDALGGKAMETADADPLPKWRGMLTGDQKPMRGRPLGPGYRSGNVSPGGSEQIEQLFLSGKRATIALSSPGKQQLTLRVKDAKHESVCRPGKTTTRCQWVPVFTQRYTIEIANTGRKSARYYLVVD